MKMDLKPRDIPHGDLRRERSCAVQTRDPGGDIAEGLGVDRPPTLLVIPTKGDPIAYKGAVSGACSISLVPVCITAAECASEASTRIVACSRHCIVSGALSAAAERGPIRQTSLERLLCSAELSSAGRHGCQLSYQVCWRVLAQASSKRRIWWSS